MATLYNKTCKHCQAAFMAHHPRTAACGDACKVELRKQAKARKAAQDKARYETNPEAVKERAAAWKAVNKDRVNELSRAAYADPEKRLQFKARIQRYRDANPELVRERERANIQRRIETGEHQALTAKRRQKMRVDLTEAEAAKVAQFYRVARLLTARCGVAFEVDHIFPIARGGKHHPDNLQVLRWDINRAKGAKLPY